MGGFAALQWLQHHTPQPISSFEETMATVGFLVFGLMAFILGFRFGQQMPEKKPKKTRV